MVCSSPPATISRPATIEVLAASEAIEVEVEPSRPYSFAEAVQVGRAKVFNVNNSLQQLKNACEQGDDVQAVAQAEGEN